MPASSQPTLYLIVGLPGAGKTTRARALEAERRALRLTPDEWMIPLFGESESDGKRDIVEGRFVSLAERALRIGTSVVLDFGLWGRDERSSLRWLASEVGARCVVEYLPIDAETQRQRVEQRFRNAPDDTLPMTQAELDLGRSIIQEPDAVELDETSPIPGPPEGFTSWSAWIAARWQAVVGQPAFREDDGIPY